MKEKIYSLVLFFVMGLCVAAGLWAQSGSGSDEQPRGVIIYADGNGFEHIHDGETREVDLSVGIAEGMELEAGDYINTYDGTFLEVQIMPSRNVLKISENTSFRVKEMSKKGGGNFELTYGRVRARVEKMAGLERFSLEGPSVVAGVRGTDFGYDIIYEQEETSVERTVASVYCFEGEVEVETTAEAGETLMEESESAVAAGADEGVDEDKKTVVVIRAGEMVRLVERPASPIEGEEPGVPEEAAVEYAFIKEGVREDVRSYWDRYQFRGEVMELPEEEVEEPIEVVSEEELRKARMRSRLRTAGAVSGGIGLVLGGTALTFVYADNLWSGMDETSRDNSAVYFGTIAGVSFTTAFFSYLFSFM